MRGRDYFPLGIASGAAFCNRQQDRRILLDNIISNRHTLLMAPRRYGKSSLAAIGIHLSKFPAVEIDFYMAVSEKTVESYILNGVIQLIGKSLGPIDKLAASIKKHVKSLKPKLNIATNHVQLELTVDAESDPASNVKEALYLLEHLLKEKNRRAILLLDEFQNVGVIAKGVGIEAAIRHIAQKTKHLMLIFSGSNRKLLRTMFEDDIRPLYKLCWQMSLMRIDAHHYRKHFGKAAQLEWGSDIDDAAFEEIMSVTDRHPYYVNKLCDRLWALCDHPPQVKRIVAVWGEILTEEKSDAIKDISLLSMGQKRVLSKIATENSCRLTSKASILRLQMTSSSIVAALDGLIEKDVVEKDDKQQYRIINPVVRSYVLHSFRSQAL